MPAPRRNDPLEVTGTPNIVTDPVREREIAAEATRKFRYIRQSFQFNRATFGHGNQFNLALSKLKNELDRGENVGSMPTHPELGFAVWYLSKKAARERGDQSISESDIACGREQAARLLKPRNRRPSDPMLRLHIKAVMAVVQETTGHAVHTTRFKKQSYEPQASNRLAQFVIDFFRTLDPSISTTTIVNMILDARKEYRGRSMRFERFCPGYGVTITPF